MRTMVESECSCGCGKMIKHIKLTPYALKKRGNKRFIKGHQNRGRIHPPELRAKASLPRELNGRWKGGKMIDKNGYILIKLSSHPFSNNCGYVREHRLVMEKHLNRYLTPKEIVHHMNHDPKDNRIENLMLLPNASKHMKECRTGRRFPRKEGIWFICERCNKPFYRSKRWKDMPVRWCSWICRYPK